MRISVKSVIWRPRLGKAFPLLNAYKKSKVNTFTLTKLNDRENEQFLEVVSARPYVPCFEGEKNLY